MVTDPQTQPQTHTDRNDYNTLHLAASMQCNYQSQSKLRNLYELFKYQCTLDVLIFDTRRPHYNQFFDHIVITSPTFFWNRKIIISLHSSIFSTWTNGIIFWNLKYFVRFVGLAVPRPLEGGLQRGENFWLRLTTASAQCLHLSERFFICLLIMFYSIYIGCIKDCIHF